MHLRRFLIFTSCALVTLGIGTVIVYTQSKAYKVEGHIHVEDFFGLLESGKSLQSMIEPGYVPAPQTRAELTPGEEYEGYAIGFVTQSGIRIGVCTHGFTFASRGTYWDYQEKMKLVRYEMDDFVNRNPDLTVIGATFEVVLRDSFGKLKSKIVDNKFDVYPPAD